MRNNLHFKALLCAKISLDDYNREGIYSIINFDGALYPFFMDDMHEYRRCLDVIGETNHIEADPVEENSRSKFDFIEDNKAALR